MLGEEDERYFTRGTRFVLRFSSPPATGAEPVLTPTSKRVIVLIHPVYPCRYWFGHSRLCVLIADIHKVAT